MSLEVLLFYVEVIYLWRALPFCSVETKTQLLEKLSGPLPSEAQPVHQAMRAWLRGGILNSLNQPSEAEKVGVMGSGVGPRMRPKKPRRWHTPLNFPWAIALLMPQSWVQCVGAYVTSACGVIIPLLRIHHTALQWSDGGVWPLCTCSKSGGLTITGVVLVQSLHEALRFDGVIRNDKHILSFSLFELAMIQINRDEVQPCPWSAH